MKKQIRVIPPGGSPVEITDRTFQGRPFLRPSPKVNAIFIGALELARRRHPSVKIVAWSAMSNHCHLILWVPDAKAMSGFMGLFKSRVARELGRLHGWKGKFWEGPYDHAVISDEAAAQIARLKYVLSQGVKEGLVSRVRHWPGAHCAEALRGGERPRGTWTDRTAAYKDRLQNRQAHRPRDFVHEVELVYDKLPCWEDLSDEEYQAAVEGLIEEIEQEGWAMRKLEGIVLGSVRAQRRAIVRVNPRASPKSFEPRPGPRFHAASRAVRRQMERAYALFVEEYRRAADELRAGNRNARFPAGCFPPGLPFVTGEEAIGS